ncbi:hypothetical protein ALNOE001_09800 [Candidatus Methanobinarius endosymbioticus]|uniref:Methyltransferase type 11 domain-containing protein n=1 Tax=Candidatus Methanobinarius endosymbioticus TaxID=2006182 RepID=A0A366MD26_9EURY|nr:hypothetical protein ALNOE001_09800 [Candidatus Methanobinarius endosymbioticus]
MGKNSGEGSYNFLANFKAEVINEFISKNNIENVIEFGSGDGNQLSLSNYPNYIGFDVSESVVNKCIKKFKEDTKKFLLLDKYAGEKADLTLSLDVIYHLIEDNIFEEYMDRLFNASKKFVIIYSSNDNDLENIAAHVKHRKFTDYIEKICHNGN